MADAARLGTTAYAVLGLLSIRPRSTYELAGQMRRSLQHFWPRVASGIYEEPKKLVAAGFAVAERSTTGRRPRTVYRITPAGRLALRSWIEGSRGEAHAYESEPLVRFFFGNVGSRDALLRAIDQIGLTARRNLATWVEVAGPYAAGEGRFPERLPINALTMALAWDIAFAELSWAAWARGEVERWPDPSGPADQRALREVISTRLARTPTARPVESPEG
jgi:PadR family transcriptional regulator, regulatory protein AphA